MSAMTMLFSSDTGDSDRSTTDTDPGRSISL